MADRQSGSAPGSPGTRPRPSAIELIGRHDLVDEAHLGRLSAAVCSRPAQKENQISRPPRRFSPTRREEIGRCPQPGATDPTRGPTLARTPPLVRGDRQGRTTVCQHIAATDRIACTLAMTGFRPVRGFALCAIPRSASPTRPRPPVAARFSQRPLGAPPELVGPGPARKNARSPGPGQPRLRR